MDVILPPRCSLCGDLSPESGRLCGACWSGLSFVTQPACQHCGFPFEFPVAGLRRCAACIARPPLYDRAVAALTYDDSARRLILGFKHHDHLEHADLLAGLMARAAGDSLNNTDIIAPVPLHRSRLWARRYNQAAILAKALAKRCPTARLELGLISRIRATQQQVGLNARQRARNVRGAFALSPGAQAHINAARITLVDDVYTTGATVEACAKVLRRAGAQHISVLTCARVVKARDTDF